MRYLSNKSKLAKERSTDSMVIRLTPTVKVRIVKEESDIVAKVASPIKRTREVSEKNRLAPNTNNVAAESIIGRESSIIGRNIEFPTPVKQRKDTATTTDRPNSNGSKKEATKTKVADRPTSGAPKREDTRTKVVDRPTSNASKREATKTKDVKSKREAAKTKVVDRPKADASKKEATKTTVIDRPNSGASKRESNAGSMGKHDIEIFSTNAQLEGVDPQHSSEDSLRGEDVEVSGANMSADNGEVHTKRIPNDTSKREATGPRRNVNEPDITNDENIEVACARGSPFRIANNQGDTEPSVITEKSSPWYMLLSKLRTTSGNDEKVRQQESDLLNSRKSRLRRVTFVMNREEIGASGDLLSLDSSITSSSMSTSSSLCDTGTFTGYSMETRNESSLMIAFIMSNGCCVSHFTEAKLVPEDEEYFL